MNKNNDELQSAENPLPETLSRAERIRAIKNSIHAGENNLREDEDKVKTDVSPDNGANEEDHADDWEKELAERIARRVRQVKANKENPDEMNNGIIAEKNENTGVPKDGINTDGEKISAHAESDNAVPLQKVSPDKTDVSAAAENGMQSNASDAAEIKSKKNKKSKKKQKKTLGQSLLDLLPQKKDKISERIRKIVFLGSCVAIVVCGTMVLSYYIDTIHTQNVYDDIENVYIDYNKIPSEESETAEEGEIYTLFPWAEKLLEQNKDLVGYITIPGRKDDPEAENEIAYPVVQSDDLEKYLNTSFTGEDARAGTIFLDYRNSLDKVVDGKLAEENSGNLIVYGHNMQNGDMFGKLKNYRNDASYYGEHPIINFDSKYNHYQYKIFAFFIIDADDQSDTAFDCWNQINFADETEFYDFVNEAKRRTIRLNDVDVKYGDKLLTLSTCNSIFGGDGPGRLIVMARLVRDGEDPYEGTQNSVENTNIKWPNLYYKYNSDEKYDPDAEFIPYGGTASEDTTNTEE